MMYGITGYKFSGKDTFANMVGEPYVIDHFASKLKTICCDVFNLSMTLFTDSNLKERTFYKPVIIDNYLSVLERATGLALKPKGLVASTPRQLLQYVGTEYVRDSCDLYWVDSLVSKFSAETKVLVPDLRFLNEAYALKAAGGKIIRILRVDAPVNVDMHQSEIEIAAIEPDLVIGTVTGKFWLQQLIADLIRVGNWEEACLFDYRNSATVHGTIKSIKTHYYEV